jgi:acyl transferase domain-containing protein/thioesterase domain-containing protein/acyl carrier protein
MHSDEEFHHEDEIAITGMAGRFPGAGNIDEFWSNLKNGVESVTFFSDEELSASGVSSTLSGKSNYVRAGAILDDVYLFDASFFGYSPREAEIMDPQHRIFLECAWEAMENAGYDVSANAGRIGVFASASISNYLFYLYSNPELLNSIGSLQIAIGNASDFLPSRVSYKLNLKGPSIAIKTGCSSSLVAVHLACQSLLNGECDITLAGGASIQVPQKAGYLHQEGGIFSPDGHCRAFDARAQGTLPGSGVGIVVLKRLADAVRDRDYIHAIIKGSSVNNDGSMKIGYTAPSVNGQAEVIAEALARAQVEPWTISYIEAHGTGTAVGDPIEIAALVKAFGFAADKQGRCAIGTVKTNFGHLDAAAGIAGLMKTVLSLQHGLLPASLHFEQLNPQIDLADSPFYVNSRLAEWKRGTSPLRAGVSSYSIGGTNAHVILEEAPAREATEKSQAEHLLLISARTDAALQTATVNLLDYLRRHPEVNLADVAYTTQVGRKAFTHRRTLVCRDRDDAVAELERLDPARVSTSARELKDRAVVFLFPGQGAQYVNMGLRFYRSQPVFREQFDRCSEILKAPLKIDLRELIFPSAEKALEAAQQLQQTHLTQPAVFVVEYSLARLWMALGVRPRAMLGHSIGEYVAACLAGVLSLKEALELTAWRGRLMHSMPEGAMLAVALPEGQVRALLGEELSLAAINGHSLCTVAGSIKAVGALELRLLERGIYCRRLPTSHAFHSWMMEPVVQPFIERVGDVKLQSPKIPYLSNVTGTWVAGEEVLDAGYWGTHLRQPVRFAENLSELLKEPDQVLLEVGPGQTLASLVKAHPGKTRETVVLSSLRRGEEKQSDVAELLNTLGELWLSGVPVNWSKLHAHQRRRRIPLPTYPFERQRYRVDPPQRRSRSDSPEASLLKRQDVTDWFYLPSWKRSVPPQLLKLKVRPGEKALWLVFINECRFCSLLVERLERDGQEVISVLAGERFEERNNRLYMIDPSRREDYDALLEGLHAGGRVPQEILHLWQFTPPPEHRELSVESVVLSQERGFNSLLFLAQALAKQHTDETIQITVVSSYIEEVNGEGLLCPEKATVLGPCRVIPKEYPHITCRSIDMTFPEAGTQAEAELVDQLVAEVAAESDETAVAYRGSHRWIQSFEQIRLEGKSRNEIRLRQDGVYLITGGLSGIGFELAQYIARTVRARLIFIEHSSSSEPEESSQWLSTQVDINGGEAERRKIEQLEELDAEVISIRADIADSKPMAKVFTRIFKRFGAIHGVIHAVRSMPGSIIQLKTPEMSASILAPKVKGALVLNALLKETRPDFFVLCSSITSILGEFGRVDDCAANAFLDSFAQSRTAAAGDRPIISINWDAWHVVETVGTQSLSGPRELQGGVRTEAITPDEGLEAFSRILRFPLPQVVVSTRDFHAVVEQHKASTGSNPRRELEDASKLKTAHPRPALASGYCAPRNATEQVLADIWQELFGLEQVGIYDNFFDLGGHSLLAVNLIAQIENRFGQKLHLSTLLERATIEHLAELLLSKQDSTAAPCLISIQPCGSQRPFFCVHPAGGNVLCYTDLARHLGEDRPFYGFQARGLTDKAPPHDEVESMAAQYVEELRKVQPEGPYLLGGWSLGAIVAFEMAQQIQAQGNTVEVLALLDPMKPGPEREDDEPLVLDFVRDLGLSPERIVGASNQLLQLEPDDQLHYILEQARAAHLLPPDVDLLQLRRFFRIFKTNAMAGRSYMPRVYTGRLSLFKASEPYPAHAGETADGWASLATEGVTLYTVPGNHFTMVRDPHVRVLAEQLKACLSNCSSRLVGG